MVPTGKIDVGIGKLKHINERSTSREFECLIENPLI